ncbi:MAG: chemotaxis protein CheB [Planctomycetota bacterium]
MVRKKDTKARRTGAAGAGRSRRAKASAGSGSPGGASGAGTGDAGVAAATTAGAAACGQDQVAKVPELLVRAEAPPYVIAIGASAGGLASIEAFFHRIPANAGLAFVLIQHLSPDHKSLMAEIMTKHTSLTVRVAEEGTPLCADHLYLIPPGKLLRLGDGCLHLSERHATQLHFPIDAFFQSMAEDYGSRSVAVILSGTGTDGTHGIRHVKHAGGLVFVQDDTAQFDGMPRSAIGTGLADYILPPDKIATKVVEVTRRHVIESELADAVDPSVLATVLDAVRNVTGIDFRQYRTKTLLRRIEKRTWMRKLSTIEDYSRLLPSDPNEVQALAHELLIGVTSFFRDPEAFESLRRDVLPALLTPGGNVRLWVVGCSSGEEAYSLAILCEDYLRQHRVRANYRIFATDIDERGIAHAARGVYSRNIAGHVEQRLLDAYFVSEGDDYRIQTRIRERIVFAKHDVAQDPPFTKVDLVSCRNLLIYHQAELQTQVLTMLHFSLRSDRFLWLGPSESLGAREAAFATLDAKWRIFRKLDAPLVRLPERSVNLITSTARRSIVERQVHREEAALLGQVCSSLVRESGQAAIVVSGNDTVLYVFGDTQAHFVVAEGRPTQLLMRMLPPELSHQVAALLRKARRGEDGVLTGTSTTGGGGQPEQVVDLAVHTIQPGRDRDAVHVVVFGKRRAVATTGDGTDVRAQQDAMDRIGELESELGEARSNLQMTIEELESSNEELQSANEELIASNEELQSTNQELHSVNEELHTVNAEYQRKLAEQHLLTSDMEHLLQTTDIGTIFLDSDFRVRRYTPAITRVIPLLGQDIGRPITHIKHSLVDVDLERVADRVRERRAGLEQQVRTADGLTLLLRAVPYHDIGQQIGGVVMTLVDVTAIENARHELAEKERRFRQVAENIDEIIWIRDRHNGDFLYLSPVAEQLWGRPVADLASDRELWFHAIHEEDRESVRLGYAEGIAAGTFSIEYRVQDVDGGVRWVRDRGFPIVDDDGELVRIAGVITDITSSKLTEEQLRSTAQTMRTLALRDALTGLANRRGWEQHLQEELGRARRSGDHLASVLIDCDDFKRINDQFGHAVGDQVLREIGARLSRAVRPSDLLARIGGDEFVALLPATRSAEALRAAERMRAAVADKPLFIGDREIRVTVSLGVGSVPTSVVSGEEVMVDLHQGLSRSKRRGKNRVASSRGDGANVRQPEELAGMLRTESAFRVFGQAIRDMTDGSVAGYELLTRGPKGDIESPEVFFRMAVEFDMLTLVDMHCLRQCLAAVTAHARGRGAGRSTPMRMHVNVYPSTLMGMSAELMEELFGAAGEVGGCCLELSEQQFVGEPTYLREAVDALRRLGMRIGIDDVGFGRSSLESLIVLEPEVIKIDRAFVQGSAAEAAKRSFLKRLLGIAHSIGAEVVAEGVETPGDAQVLGDLGVRFAQGFLWDRPSPFTSRA